MPKTISKSELDAIVVAVERSGEDGAGVEALQQRFPELPRRSLQRRLAQLAAQRRIQASGKGPARRYHAIVQSVAAAGPPPKATPPKANPLGVEDDMPLSDAGTRLRQQVRRPKAQRKPVGYERRFLDAYEPNRTAYLPDVLRRRLHDMGRSIGNSRPAGTYARQILDRLLVDLSWASSRLEGNTYSRLDTQNLIEFGHYAEGKDRLEAQMILNHKTAIEMLVDAAGDVGFNRYTLQNLHALLADNLLANQGAAGRLRTIEVSIGGTVYQPTAIPQLIEECFDTLLGKARAIDDPFEQAFFVMVQLPYLQPFEDVNKRVSRIAANIPFIKRNLSPLSFVDVPEQAYLDGNLAVYELNRVELLRDVFAWAYERSCQRYTLIRQALPEPDPMRMRYRAALTDVIVDVVHANRPPSIEAIRQSASATVPAADMPAFVAMAINELAHLREGNIARYRLRLADFRHWRQHHPAPRAPAGGASTSPVRT